MAAGTYHSSSYIVGLRNVLHPMLIIVKVLQMLHGNTATLEDAAIFKSSSYPITDPDSICYAQLVWTTSLIHSWRAVLVTVHWIPPVYDCALPSVFLSVCNLSLQEVLT